MGMRKVKIMVPGMATLNAHKQRGDSKSVNGI